jgi:4-nitrophenyl phosphatase
MLEDKKLFILDMDGTFYLGDIIIGGSLDFIQKLKEKGKKFIFFTNNASKIAKDYKDKLLGMGLHVNEEDIITSGDVTIEYLLKNFPKKKVYLVGTSSLEESFRKAGISLVEKSPDVVVVSFDLTLTYEKISKACTFIREGAHFIATHMDFNCPTEHGFIPDCGSICAMITASTGVKPKFLGKPFEETVDMIENLTGYKKSEMVIIGDRLYTDIATGFNNKITTALVLTGETKLEDLKETNIKPDFIFQSLFHIGEAL